MATRYYRATKNKGELFTASYDLWLDTTHPVRHHVMASADLNGNVRVFSSDGIADWTLLGALLRWTTYAPPISFWEGTAKPTRHHGREAVRLRLADEVCCGEFDELTDMAYELLLEIAEFFGVKLHKRALPKA